MSLMDVAAYRPQYIGGKRVASPEYRSWQMMKNRCTNPKCKDFTYYNGKGIWPTWLSFDNFIRDMGPKPTPKHTLERRDNSLGYGPDNCEWATRKTQARNRTFIKVYRGKTVWEWAHELGIKPKTFHMRLWRFKRGDITETQLFRAATEAWKCKVS